MLEDFQTLFDDALPALTYTIYRGVARGMETELIAFGLADPYFVDSTALGGVTYWYVVYAQTSCGLSPISNEVSAMLSCCTRYTADDGCSTVFMADETPVPTWTAGSDCSTVWTTDGC